MENDKLKIEELNKKLKRINSLVEKIPNYLYSDSVSYNPSPSEVEDVTLESWCPVVFDWDKEGKLVEINVYSYGNYLHPRSVKTRIEYDAESNVSKIIREDEKSSFLEILFDSIIDKDTYELNKLRPSYELYRSYDTPYISILYKWNSDELYPYFKCPELGNLLDYNPENKNFMKNFKQKTKLLNKYANKSLLESIRESGISSKEITNQNIREYFNYCLVFEKHAHIESKADRFIDGKVVKVSTKYMASCYSLEEENTEYLKKVIQSVSDIDAGYSKKTFVRDAYDEYSLNSIISQLKMYFAENYISNE